MNQQTDLEQLRSLLVGRTVVEVEAASANEQCFALRLDTGDRISVFATDLGWWVNSTRADGIGRLGGVWDFVDLVFQGGFDAHPRLEDGTERFLFHWEPERVTIEVRGNEETPERENVWFDPSVAEFEGEEADKRSQELLDALPLGKEYWGRFVWEMSEKDRIRPLVQAVRALGMTPTLDQISNAWASPMVQRTVR